MAAGGRRKRLRLIFDEQLSVKVAQALAVLGFAVEHVNGADQPPKGSSDADVLAHAIQCRQTIVTKNHDMIVLCALAGVNVIWLDGRGKSWTRAEMVRICFGAVEAWREHFETATDPICVVQRKTTIETLTLERALKIALRRGHERTLRKAGSQRRPKASGDQLALDLSPFKATQDRQLRHYRQPRVLRAVVPAHARRRQRRTRVRRTHRRR